MARFKMDRPQRAEFFRVFPRHLLMDEAYEFLTREEWGSVFLLMMNQWSRDGSLPEDHQKLAIIAKCSIDELQALMEKWPKLKPIEELPGRVGIPYLNREWDQVMGFYQEQAIKSAKGVQVRMRNRDGVPSGCRDAGVLFPMCIPMMATRGKEMIQSPGWVSHICCGIGDQPVGGGAGKLGDPAGRRCQGRKPCTLVRGRWNSVKWMLFDGAS